MLMVEWHAMAFLKSTCGSEFEATLPQSTQAASDRAGTLTSARHAGKVDHLLLTITCELRSVSVHTSAPIFSGWHYMNSGSQCTHQLQSSVVGTT